MFSRIKIQPLLSAFIAGVEILMIATSLWAHHAGSTYDQQHPITLTGVVTAYQLINPHTQIHFETKDAQGNVEKWVALSGPPQRLYRAGWRADTLKPGDQITITGAPSKDGRKYMGVKKMIAPSGQVLTEGAE